MSEPEIARRCQSCGASVRGRAHFCPQCGRPMGDGGAWAAGGDERGRDSLAAAPAARATAQHPLAEEAERMAFALGDKLGAAPGRDAAEPAAPAVEPTPPAGGESAAVVEVARAGEPRDGHALGGDARKDDALGGDARGAGAAARGGVGVLGRAAGVGARAGESLRPGVDRLRGTLVAFEEASSDDPGLRFVVVAGLLFLVFLLLWLFSYVLG
ncbi:MAG: zinc ribbon domain-containing protein [Acidobacteria bacterium]|nr:zinc ribbon domain-containing protein [Acidobacteriota bacterium]